MNKTLPCKKQRSGALHLTQKVDYALIILMSLAKNDEKSLSIKQIAKSSNLSFLFLQKIAGILQQNKIIEAKRGKYGGYKLIKDPKKITIKEIIEAVEGPIAIIPCLKSFSEPQCCKKNKKCEIRLGLQKINQEIENFLAKKTLYQIIA